MKDTAITVVKSVFDVIFSFWTIFIVCAGFLMYIGVESAENEAKAKEQNRLLTEACYNQGMVLVNTDAGQRCAAPQSLVKIK